MINDSSEGVLAEEVLIVMACELTRYSVCPTPIDASNLWIFIIEKARVGGWPLRESSTTWLLR